MRNFYLITLFSLVIVGSYGTLLPSEDYWKSVLPNTPMPKSLMELLPSGVGSTSIKPQRITNAAILQAIAAASKKIYNIVYDKQVQDTIPRISDNINYAAKAGQVHNNRQVALFFLEKNMYRGGKLYFNFIKLAAKPSMFLPRSTAQTIPFSSAQIPEILTRFSVKPDSVEAKFMKETILECVSLEMEGEEKICPSSLESMIDFSVSKFGKKVLVFSSEVEKAKSGVQGYSIKGVKKMASDNAVVCHKQYYPYAVFYCHKTNKVDTYKVSMIGDDGTKAEAVAVCHKDTSAWNPKHTAFMVLKVKPGTVPVCHFLLQDTVVWVPY